MAQQVKELSTNPNYQSKSLEGIYWVKWTDYTDMYSHPHIYTWKCFKISFLSWISNFEAPSYGCLTRHTISGFLLFKEKQKQIIIVYFLGGLSVFSWRIKWQHVVSLALACFSANPLLILSHHFPTPQNSLDLPLLHSFLLRTPYLGKWSQTRY